MSAIELQADDRSKASLLASRDLVARMGWQPRVVNALHIGLLFQPLRQAHRVAAMMIETRMQSPQAAQCHEAIERRTSDPKTVRPPDELLMQPLVTRHDSSADHVAVTVQVLGRRVNDQIGAEWNRLLPGRREEGVVDDDQSPTGPAECCDGLDVRDPQQGVAGRLDPQQ